MTVNATHLLAYTKRVVRDRQGVRVEKSCVDLAVDMAVDISC